MLTPPDARESSRPRPVDAATRPLLPNWGSVAITALAVIATLALVGSLAVQNRQLKQALALGEGGPAAARTPIVGDQLPSVQLISSAGEEQDLLDLVRGGGVVAFLTTTCRFCEASLPAWEKVAQGLAGTGTPFVALSLHGQEQTREFATSKGVAFPLWVLADPTERALLQINAVPVTALVSPTGEIRQIWRGQVTEDQLVGIVGAVAGDRCP